MLIFREMLFLKMLLPRLIAKLNVSLKIQWLILYKMTPRISREVTYDLCEDFFMYCINCYVTYDFQRNFWCTTITVFDNNGLNIRTKQQT